MLLRVLDLLLLVDLLVKCDLIVFLLLLYLCGCLTLFIEQGCHLVIVGRRENRLQEIKNKLNSDYPAVDVYTVALDISNTQLVGQLPSNLPSNFRDVDLLINNAGLALGVTSVEENSIADASTVMNTNIMGTVAFCSAFIPGMVKRGTGHIVNIGSCAG